MHTHHDAQREASRRQFLAQSGLGFGALAASALFGRPARASDGARAPARPARARSVIYLHMAGSPPQLDLFDHKPELQRLDGTLCPQSFLDGRRLAFIKGHPTLLGSPHAFQRVGQSGMHVSELMPRFGGVVDKLCMIHSMHTEQFNHAPAQLLLHTGRSGFDGASLGAWATYGLGSHNADLPGYVVMISGDSDPSGGKTLWGSGFLPSSHQGVQLRSTGDPVLYVSDPPGMSRAGRRRSLDALRSLNELDHATSGDPETLARIEQYELAFRMQSAVPGAVELDAESAEVHALYGSQPGQSSFANHCLMARRLVERGVRFVQLYDYGWDIHGTGSGDDLLTQFPQKCRDVDQPIAALLLDLERRGLLDETLVVWGGEFGRTSMNEARGGSTYLGRDHHPDCFTMWMAGGGVKAGYRHGETDELGYTIARDPVSVRDLQATILHLLGLDPFRLSFPFQGLEQRLIGPDDAAARVQHALLA